MIDLSGTQPAWPADALASWQECAAAAARIPGLWRVPQPQGEELLRERIGARFGLDPSMITVTAGVRASALTYGRLASRILLERPTFPGVLHVLTGTGAAVELADWERMLHGPLPADCTLWFTSPFRNPDGASLTAQDAAAVGDRVRSGHRVIVNAAYAWFAEAGTGAGARGSVGPGPELGGADVLGTLHKVAGHGARLGWVYSADFFDRAVPELLGTPPSPVWQRAWALFLGCAEFAALEHAIVAGAAAASAAFARRMRERRGPSAPPMYASGVHERREMPDLAASAPHVLLRLAPGWSEEHAVARLRERGFLVCPAAPFRAASGAVRVSFFGVDSEQAQAFADAVLDCDSFAGDEHEAS